MAARMRRYTWASLGFRTAQAGIVVLIIAAWQLATQFGLIDPFFAGSPAAIWDQLWQWIDDGTLLGNTWHTISVMLAGWAIGAIVGTGVGLVLGTRPFVRQALTPLLAFFNGMPRLIVYPFFAVWLGYGPFSKITLIAFVVVFIVIFNVIAGIREVSGDLTSNVRVLGGGTIDLAAQVYLPSIALWLVGSARLTMGFALQAAVISEFLGSPEGLGSLAVQGEGQYDTNMIWAAIAILVVVAILLDFVISKVQNLSTRWKMAS